MPAISGAARRSVRRLRGRLELGATKPVSDVFGFDRGTPVDRVYIERFLAAHQAEIRGSVLEVGETRYVSRFGADRPTHVDVLDIRSDNPVATIVADLTDTAALPESQFDCIIVTQVLFLLSDMESGVRSLHRMLKPGGTLLLSVPVTSRICDDEPDQWRLTSRGLKWLVDRVFGPGVGHVEAHGNLTTSIAFLRGMAAEDMSPRFFADDDPRFELVAFAHAIRS